MTKKTSPTKKKERKKTATKKPRVTRNRSKDIEGILRMFAMAGRDSNDDDDDYMDIDGGELNILRMLQDMERETGTMPDFLPTGPDYEGLMPAASGEWVNGKEVLSRTQFKSNELPSRKQLLYLDNVTAAANLLGVTLPPSPDAVRARLRRLALRYPPDLAPQKHEEFMQAARLLQHPLQVLSAGMSRWPSVENSTRSLPDITLPIEAILKDLGALEQK